MTSNALAAPGHSEAAGETATARPALVVDIEMSLPVKRIESRAVDGRQYRSAWILVQVFGEAVGLVPLDFTDGSLDPDGIVRAIDRECGEAVRSRVQEAEGNVADVMAGRGCHTAAVSGFRARHKSVIEHGPEITVAICTRNRPGDLSRALSSLHGQTYERFNVLIVDNAPDTDETEMLVEALAGSGNIRYAREERPGLSWARNRALELVRTPVIAWLDDDEIADENWLTELARAFSETPGVAAVSGSVIPAELETDAQLWFEVFGGHSKGRGFTSDIFGLPGDRRQSPLYPLPPFGVGANMAFDVEILRSLGGFDTALGAGTATLGGEDTLTFTQILLRGGLIAYRPSALTRHFHRPDYPSLARQMRGYGIGLTAYYAALLRGNWRLILPMVRLAPRALRDSFGASGNGMAGVPSSFPRELLRIKTKGMLAGPLAYGRARRKARALARTAP